MNTISNIRGRAKLKQKTIALPEYNESRTQKACEIIEKEGLAKVLLLSPDKIIQSEKERYIQEFLRINKSREMSIDEVSKLFNDPIYYAAMLTREGKVDGFVAGASHTTPDVARCALRCLELDERITVMTSAFIMAVPGCEYGEAGTFVFADCGIIPEPSARQLACISLAAAGLLEKVLGITARIAMLSYSTKGSAKGKLVEKIHEALKLLKEMKPDLSADGEMQVDAAIVPEVARIKYPESPVAGKANVLVFPNLEAGNIGYKLVQRLANARAVGPLLLGLSRPCSDLSRGCSVEDIVDCVAITAIMAQ
ncbi:MAG: phosphate acyltransferase [Candidatus Omnitrophota bacterium]